MNTLADGPAQAPRMPVRRARLSELYADPANARQHDEKNLDAIAASLRQFGQVEPLVVQKSTGKVIGATAGWRCCAAPARPRWTSSRSM